MRKKLGAQLRQFLWMMAEVSKGQRPKGWKYSSIAEFYLKEGHVFPHRKFTAAERKTLLRVFQQARPGAEMKQCFYNAQYLVMSSPQLTYGEGYVAIPDVMLPIHHGWAVLNGKPVDVTLRRRDAAEGCDPEALFERAAENLKRVVYFGVEFSKKDVMRLWRGEVAQSIVEDWKGGFPILRRGVRKNRPLTELM